MVKNSLLILGCVLGFTWGPAICVAQQNEADIHVTVDMVQLSVAVTDSKGNYVTGLRPEDFIITEDGIQQKLATFGEGNEPTRQLVEAASGDGKPAYPAADPPADSRQPGPTHDLQTLSSQVVGGARLTRVCWWVGGWVGRFAIPGGGFHQLARGFVALAKGGKFLLNPIFGDDEVLGAKAGDVVSLAVCHRHT